MCGFSQFIDSKEKSKQFNFVATKLSCILANLGSLDSDKNVSPVKTVESCNFSMLNKPFEVTLEEYFHRIRQGVA